MHESRGTLSLVAAALVVSVVGYAWVHQSSGAPLPRLQTAAVSSGVAATTTAPTSTSSVVRSSIGTSSSSTTNTTKRSTASIQKAPSLSKPLPVSSTTPAAMVARIETPYSTAPQSFEAINTTARSAVVNILCKPRSGAFNEISGTGVIIDPRGVILTNAHVAQYVLLSESPSIDLSCVIRTGSPAAAAWRAEVLYIPPVWVAEHAADINTAHPTGTGEHDYALLRIVGATRDTSLPAQFPFLPVDSRENVAFLGDTVLGASYPAEFLGAGATESSLYAVSSVSHVQQLLTFGSQSIDAFSIGGVIEAQGGSSGGAVVNAWGYLVGLITTTSEGATTATRDLRALSMSYINRDIKIQSGQNLNDLLKGDLIAQEDIFNAGTGPDLLGRYLKVIGK